MKSPEEISVILDDKKEFGSYLDNFDRKSDGAGSQKDPPKDRTSAKDVRTLFANRGGLSKAEGAQMVLDYAKEAEEAGSSLGGGSRKALDKLRGYLGEKAPEPERDPEPYQMSEELASAKANVKSFEETMLPNQGNIIFGLDKDAEGKSTNTEKYLGDYALNLKGNLKPVYSDGSSRKSKLRQEEDAVEGMA